MKILKKIENIEKIEEIEKILKIENIEMLLKILKKLKISASLPMYENSIKLLAPDQEQSREVLYSINN